MIGEKIRIDDYYEYEIKDIKEGGMGQVYILNRVSAGDELFDALADNHPRLADEYSLTYRKKIAAKTFKKNDFFESNKKSFERELNIWITFDCPNVAKLLKILFIKNNLFAIMPYYNSSLRDMIRKQGRLEIENAKSIIINIIHGLYGPFKTYGVVHQDLKPENVLVDFVKDETHFFVSDWGIANIQKTYCPERPSKEILPSTFVETMTGMGTLPYMSPERFIGYPSNITADIFSLGLIFYELLFGRLPYDYKSPKPLVSQIMDFDYFYIAENLLRKHFDDKVTELVLKCLHPNVSKRYNDYKKLVLEVHSIGIKRKFFFF